MPRTESNSIGLGTPLPEFALAGPNGLDVGPHSVETKPALLVAFISNRCPFVVLIREELARIGRAYADRGLAVIAINANDAGAHPEESADRVADEAVEQTLRNTSQFALMPVFILVLGIGEASKIAITFYAAVFFLLINTIVGVKSVDPLLLKAARSMGTSDLDLFRKVIFPSAIPSIVAGARLGVKSSLFSVIAAEMLAAQSGIGYLIQHAQLMLETPDMYAGIITLTIVGLLVNYGLVWIERRATRWRGTAEDGGLMPH